MIRRKWVELAPPGRPDRDPYYWPTDEGIAFAGKHALARITRSRAERLLKEFLQRVEEVNGNDDFGVFVEQISLFGSFLDTSRKDYGDIDLALSLPPHPIIGRAFGKYEDERMRAWGKHVPGALYRDFLYEEVRRYLRARSPYISLHGLLYMETLGAEMVPIYKAPDSDRHPRAHRGR